MSYNCRGLRTGNSAYDRARRQTVSDLLKDHQIVCLQETWFTKQDLASLNTIYSDYHGVGEATVDENDFLQHGHPPGGVAILWHIDIEHCVKPLHFNVDWAVGVEMTLQSKRFVIVNVYLPYESVDNEPMFINKMTHICSLVDSLDSTCVFITGDFNANVLDARSSFAEHFVQCIEESGLILSSKALLPNDTFTFISNWHTVSWLDHFVCSADAHDSISKMEVYYNYVTDDHVPIGVELNIQHVPEHAGNNQNVRKKLDWSIASEAALDQYCNTTDTLLQSIDIPYDALSCRNARCSSEIHRRQLDRFYNDVVDCLTTSSRHLETSSRRHRASRPGWNAHVAEAHSAARDAFLFWKSQGKPRQGPVFKVKKRLNARFKYALRYIKKNEEAMRHDSLAEKLLSNNTVEFWKEIKLMDNRSTPLPTNIDGKVGEREIVSVWREKYKEIFNCVPSDINSIIFDNLIFCNEMIVDTQEVQDAIRKLDCGKACGDDAISACNRCTPLKS